MKLALVYPRFKYQSGAPPIGLLQIAASIRQQNKASLDFIDTTYEQDISTFRERVRIGAYDLVGLYVMTAMLDDVALAVREIKSVSPKTKILLGGPHASVMAEHAMTIEGVDAVCFGEGEATIVELIEAELDFAGIAGLLHRVDGKLVRNEARSAVTSLDALPFPAYDLLDDHYFDECSSLDIVRPGLRTTSILVSRGCPYSCSYCQPTLSTIFGKRIRRLSPRRIVELIQWLKADFAIEAFSFVDDTLLFARSWVDELCQLLIEAKTGLIFSCNTRANLVDPVLLAQLYEAGLRKVYLGVESASQRILDDVYQKGTTIAEIKAAVKAMKMQGISILGYFMMGAPSETVKEIRQTITLATELDIDEATFSITTPLPGTYLFDRTETDIEVDLASFDYYHTPVYRQGVTVPSNKLVWLKREAFLRFYLSPKRLYQTLASFMCLRGMRKNLLRLQRF